MGIGSTIGGALSKVGSKISSALTSRAGKFVTAGAAIGGGSYLALTGVGAGAENLMDSTGLSTVTNYITGNSEGGTSGKGVGTLIGIAVLAGIIVLAVYVIIPQFNKTRNSKKNNG